MKQRSESKCKRCQQVLPRAYFFLDSKGFLKGAICRECAPAWRREGYLARGGYEAEFRGKKRYYAKHPWAKTLRNIQHRVDNPKYPAYVGIKNRITVEELEYLWHRDKAAEMIVPSIDRISPEGDYTLENCRYLELAENIARARPANSFLT